MSQAVERILPICQCLTISICENIQKVEWPSCLQVNPLLQSNHSWCYFYIFKGIKCYDVFLLEIYPLLLFVYSFNFWKKHALPEVSLVDYFSLFLFIHKWKRVLFEIDQLSLLTNLFPFLSLGKDISHILLI